MPRAYHRWAAAAIGVFLLPIAGTGIALQVDLLVSGTAPPGAEPDEKPSPLRPMPEPAVLDRSTKVVVLAMRRHAGISAERIEFNFAAPRPFATVGAVSPFGEAVRVDLETGAVSPAPELDAGLHGALQDIHAGYAVGWPGRLISILAGLGLLVLAVTGLKMYLEMYLRRRKSKGPSPFWR